MKPETNVKLNLLVDLGLSNALIAALRGAKHEIIDVKSIVKQSRLDLFWQAANERFVFVTHDRAFDNFKDFPYDYSHGVVIFPDLKACKNPGRTRAALDAAVSHFTKKLPALLGENGLAKKLVLYKEKGEFIVRTSVARVLLPKGNTVARGCYI